MAKFSYSSSSSYSFVFIVVYTVALCMNCDADHTEKRQLHIVYMGSLPEGKYSPASHHYNILKQVVDSSFLGQSLVRSYQRSFNGFAAYLTDQESQKIASDEGVVSVFKSETLQIQTTRAWDFVGLSEQVFRNSTTETDIIIGFLDTGIWPESDSFSDQHIGPIPKNWKGECKGGKNFTCNRKIIGARYYNSMSTLPEDSTARDIEGHGTHTASTAAGNHVSGSSFYGLAQGTARGGVPSARIAAYKVCTVGGAGCEFADILAAFDDAIADGVDIISVSLGSNLPRALDRDVGAIGSFHAMARGILTVASAGNSGPYIGTVSNVAPWLFSVAASTTDRRFVTQVVLGNGRKLMGAGVNPFYSNGTFFPVIHGKDATLKPCDSNMANKCYDGCLDSKLVKGKIVLCQSPEGFYVAYKAGAVGSVIPKDGELSDYLNSPYPSSSLSAKDISLVDAYVNSTKAPRAKILKSRAIHDSKAPIVVDFSSRGPNIPVLDILKPDISAPGANILAAYSPLTSPSSLPGDKRSVKYDILSGTSMSCPIVTGAVAYIKSLHPKWSPAAIRSALMTTASRMHDDNSEQAELAYGAGHIDPVKAANPGLVYDTSAADYVELLCTIGLNTSALVGSNVRCPRAEKKGTARDLNYPTFTASIEKQKPFKFTFPRKVTNVGLAKSLYKATITKDSLLNVTVNPSVLFFPSFNETKSFVVTVEGKGLENLMASAALVWSDGIHSVRSPIVVHTVTNVPT